MRALSFTALALLAVSLIPLGCGDDNGTNPSPPPSFSRYWPNADSSSWTFDYREYSAAESIIPALEGLDALPVDEISYLDLERRLSLERPTPDTSAVSIEGSLRVALNGNVQTPSAGEKQNLETVLSPIAKTPRSTSAGLLRRIYLARPELRDKMIAMDLAPNRVDVSLSPSNVGPIFDFPENQAFESKDNWIGYYGDFNADSTYTILKAPLTPGSFFRHQLVPVLTDDIWEYGWILGERRVETTAGVFRDALGVVYFIDFGLGIVRAENGDSIGTFHSFALSDLFLVPDVGPVYQRGLDRILAYDVQSLLADTLTNFNEASLREYDIRE